MLKSDFYYHLPEELIAQEPIEPRDASRLLVMDKQTGALTDGTFRDIKHLLRPGDCLILNNSRVLPARLIGERVGTGAAVELLLLTPHGNDVWEVLAGPGRRAKKDYRLSFGGGLLKAEVLDVLEGGNRLVKFEYEGNFYAVLDQIGQMPLPPYITSRAADMSRYQNQSKKNKRKKKHRNQRDHYPFAEKLCQESIEFHIITSNPFKDLLLFLFVFLLGDYAILI